MKLAICSKGENLESEMDERFGRTNFFILYETEDDTFEVHTNKQNMNAAQGAGIQAAQTVADINADILVCAHCGPKAFKTLQAAEIPVITTNVKPINEVIKQFKNNELKAIQQADVDGHWM